MIGTACQNRTNLKPSLSHVPLLPSVRSGSVEHAATSLACRDACPHLSSHGQPARNAGKGTSQACVGGRLGEPERSSRDGGNLHRAYRALVENLKYMQYRKKIALTLCRQIQTPTQRPISDSQ